MIDLFNFLEVNRNNNYMLLEAEAYKTHEGDFVLLASANGVILLNQLNNGSA